LKTATSALPEEIDNAALRPAPIRLSLVGFGTVGRWLATAIHEQTRLLAEKFGVMPILVNVANAREFIHRQEGLDIA